MLILSTFFITSCKTDEEAPLWYISGTVIMKDAETPEIREPMEGIKVYLLKGFLSVDTTTNWFSRSDILDSAKTDANGFYSFGGLAPDNYVVLPGDTTLDYHFDWSESPDSVWIASDNSKNEFEINFTTPEPVEENLELLYWFVFKLPDNISVRAYRTARVNAGCGWFGMSPCDWYWKWKENLVSVYDPPTLGSRGGIFADFICFKYENNIIYSYKNEFHFKFYYTDPYTSEWIYTLHVSEDDLTAGTSNKNAYLVSGWSKETLEVTRVN